MPARRIGRIDLHFRKRANTSPWRPKSVQQRLVVDRRSASASLRKSPRPSSYFRSQSARFARVAKAGSPHLVFEANKLVRRVAAKYERAVLQSLAEPAASSELDRPRTLRIDRRIEPAVGIGQLGGRWRLEGLSGVGIQAELVTRIVDDTNTGACLSEGPGSRCVAVGAEPIGEVELDQIAANARADDDIIERGQFELSVRSERADAFSLIEDEVTALSVHVDAVLPLISLCATKEFRGILNGRGVKRSGCPRASPT